MAQPENSPFPRRTLKALIAATITGVIIYLLVLRLGLPALADSLTPAQIDWLRTVFRDHPVGTLLTIALLAGAVALPVLVVFRLVYGPLRETRRE